MHVISANEGAKECTCTKEALNAIFGDFRRYEVQFQAYNLIVLYQSFDLKKKWGTVARVLKAWSVACQLCLSSIRVSTQ